MRTPITKAATIVCNSSSQIDLTAIKCKIQINDRDIVDAADVGPTKALINGCKGHLSG